ncbi:transporter substrate-binding protein [Bradyrhizobium sp. ISRA435]|nr:transporter substrate-binding protein [Bradyrhizobium sp. ISRA435]
MNSSGGILGRRVQVVTEDTQASSKVAVDKARRLLVNDGAVALIGTVLPLEREAALQVAASQKRLVIHPNFDEGRCHPNLLTTGLSDVQRVEPMISWLAAHGSRRGFVMISDSGTARNSFVPLLKSVVEAHSGTLVGVRYFPFGTRDFGPALQQVKDADVDFVWHSIGDDPITFVKQYHSFGMKPQLVTEITHESIAKVTDGASIGNLGVSSYFMSVDNPENRTFIERYSTQFANFTGVRVDGKVPVLPHGESTYVGARVFAEAARIAQSVELDKLKEAFAKISLDMPRGKVGVDAGSSHLLCKTLIGRAREDCMFDLVDVAGPIQTVCK